MNIIKNLIKFSKKQIFTRVNRHTRKITFDQKKKNFFYIKNTIDERQEEVCGKRTQACGPYIYRRGEVCLIRIELEEKDEERIQSRLCSGIQTTLRRNGQSSEAMISPRGNNIFMEVSSLTKSDTPHRQTFAKVLRPQDILCTNQKQITYPNESFFLCFRFREEIHSKIDV